MIQPFVLGLALPSLAGGGDSPPVELDATVAMLLQSLRPTAVVMGMETRPETDAWRRCTAAGIPVAAVLREDQKLLVPEAPDYRFVAQGRERLGYRTRAELFVQYCSVIALVGATPGTWKGNVLCTLIAARKARVPHRALLSPWTRRESGLWLSQVTNECAELSQIALPALRTLREPPVATSTRFFEEVI